MAPGTNDTVGLEAAVTEPPRGAEAHFEEALLLFRGGDDLGAHQAAQSLLARAPGHVGGMMLLLATAGGCGDDRAINESLAEVSGYFGRMLLVPEVLELFQSHLLAPVLRSQAFSTVFAPALHLVSRQTRDGADREVASRLMREAAQDAAIDAALARAPVDGAAPVLADPVIHLVDLSTGETLANLGGERAHLVGRHPKASVWLDDPFVSREHLELSRGEGIWTAQSLSPTNPLVLNGRALGLMPSALRHGDELKLGCMVLGVFSGPGGPVGEVDGGADPHAVTKLEVATTMIPPPAAAAEPDAVRQATLEMESEAKGKATLELDITGLADARRKTQRPRA